MDNISLVSLVPRRFEDGAWSGVPRFDCELRRIFPEILSLNTSWKSRLYLAKLARREPETIVITGNETSLLVPDGLRTIVVHHGCAQTHFDRDPRWRTGRNRKICLAQERMYQKKNRFFVAPSRWTAERFSYHYGVKQAPVIPSWVEPVEKGPCLGRPVILGDWRTWNKGQGEVIDLLRKELPHYEFLQLDCSYETRKQVYRQAHCYLCLSLSEGASYAMADAEAAWLPIVTTDVGSYQEYGDSVIIPWQKRGDVEQVNEALRKALDMERLENFFTDWTFEKWKTAWWQLVEHVAGQRRL
jgi:glycosyltransferase involved in cell wall biosynthesis